jgi:uncharacterized membrane protein
MAAKALDFTYEAHPRIEARREESPPKVDDERVGFNGRLASLITRGVGNMWTFYAVATVMGMWIAFLGKLAFGDGYPFPLMLLVFGGIIQMLLMIAIMVGQQVLGAAADKRADQTYKDAEAILHECQQLQAHLQAQDTALSKLIEAASR